MYKICGLPGFFIALLLILTVKQKKIASRSTDNNDEETNIESSAVETGS